MDQWMTGRVAVITGASGGIGRATAETFGRLGAKLALFDIADGALESLANELHETGVDCLTRRIDVCDLDSMKRAMCDAEQRWDRLDFVVSVAGGGTPHTLDTLTTDAWDAELGLNLTGPMNAILAGSAALRRSGGGSIVTVGSIAGIRMSISHGPAYTTAKAGVLGMTRHAAFELARDEINVNAVLPGPVRTPQVVARLSPERMYAVAETIPIRRWLEPEEVAHAIAYFCHPLARAVTGTSLVIDGGLHIGATSSVEDHFDQRKAGKA